MITQRSLPWNIMKLNRHSQSMRDLVSIRFSCSVEDIQKHENQLNKLNRNNSVFKIPPLNVCSFHLSSFDSQLKTSVFRNEPMKQFYPSSTGNFSWSSLQNKIYIKGLGSLCISECLIGSENKWTKVAFLFGYLGYVNLLGQLTHGASENRLHVIHNESMFAHRRVELSHLIV